MKLETARHVRTVLADPSRTRFKSWLASRRYSPAQYTNETVRTTKKKKDSQNKTLKNLSGNGSRRLNPPLRARIGDEVGGKERQADTTARGEICLEDRADAHVS